MVFAQNIFVMKPEKYIFTVRQKLIDISNYVLQTLDVCHLTFYFFNNDLDYFLSFENIYVKAISS